MSITFALVVVGHLAHWGTAGGQAFPSPVLCTGTPMWMLHPAHPASFAGGRVFPFRLSCNGID